MKDTLLQIYRLSDTSGQPNTATIDAELKCMAKAGYSVDHTFTYIYQSVPQLGVMYSKNIKPVKKTEGK